STTIGTISPKRYAGRASMITATRRPPRVISNRFALSFDGKELLCWIAKAIAPSIVVASFLVFWRGLAAAAEGDRSPKLESRRDASRSWFM
ncbi:MAG: hypothetical protein Q9198_004427, partial [Flavoplaca austrocitrina]